MSNFVTSVGRIKKREQNGLRPINQRRVAKAVKRAQGLGLMPRWYKHPELMRILTEKSKVKAAKNSQHYFKGRRP